MSAIRSQKLTAKDLGSTITLVAAVFLVAASGKVLLPLEMILGALAYRSAKNRLLGEAKSDWPRIVAECAALTGIFLAVVFQKSSGVESGTAWISNLLVPSWALVAYLSCVVRASLRRRLQR